MKHRFDHAAVEKDLIALAHWILRDSERTTERFLDAAEATISGLSFMPGRGSPKGSRGTRYPRIRTAHVTGFPNHLAVYDLRDDDVFVLAVVHGAQNSGGMIRKRLR